MIEKIKGKPNTNILLSFSFEESLVEDGFKSFFSTFLLFRGGSFLSSWLISCAIFLCVSSRFDSFLPLVTQNNHD